MGTMEARENTKVTLFTLSLAEENTIIIGGAYLLNWSFSRTDPQKGKIQWALFNLLIMEKLVRAIKANIADALVKMLSVDEA